MRTRKLQSILPTNNGKNFNKSRSDTGGGTIITACPQLLPNHRPPPRRRVEGGALRRPPHSVRRSRAPQSSPLHLISSVFRSVIHSRKECARARHRPRG